MKKTLLALSIVLSGAIIFQSCKKIDDASNQKRVVEVGGIFSKTGNWSTLGKSSEAAMKIAADDINDYLVKKNADFRLGVSVADSKLDTTAAKNLFTQAYISGYSFIIGPQSSAELAAIKPLADAANMLVISQSSTAGSLAINNDNIFRFCPSDKVEGVAIAATIKKKGITALVTVARNDAGNKGLQTSTGTSFTALGGKVTAITPYATTTTDFSAVISSLKAEVANLTATEGAGKVGVYIASFDEGVALFKAATAESSLSNIKWFGGDGIVQSAALAGDVAAADFAIKTEFFAPSFGLSAATEAKWKPIAARIKAITGTDPDAFALVIYDAMWVITHTVENSAGLANLDAFKAKFAEHAALNDGITGSNTLDAAGDRATGTYDYFGLVKEGTTYKWTKTGTSE